MKIYVASKFENKEVVREVYKQLKENEFKITCDWTNHQKTSDKKPKHILKKQAIEDYQGICDADILLFLPPGGKGTHIEIGIAMGKGTPVVIIGNVVKENGFYNHPLVQKYNTITEFFDTYIDIEK